MGCDIHLHIETKTADGTWAAVPFRDKYAQGKDKDGYAQVNYDGLFKDPLYVGRHYNVFAVLANVRNGRGFAGVRTGSGFVPIDLPRGVPRNASPEAIRDYTLRVVPVRSDTDERVAAAHQAEKWIASGASRWWDEKAALITHPDWHSASWLLAAELRDYNWQQTVTQCGVVDPAQYQEFVTRGKPSGWSGGVSGGRVRHVSNADMERLLRDKQIHWLKPLDPERFHNPYVAQEELDRLGTKLEDYTREAEPLYPLTSYYTTVKWEESYAAACGDFTTRFLPALLAVGDPDKTRIVFWFDN